jgi:Cu(I)/Ag(I) efflux system membrane fusion protein
MSRAGRIGLTLAAVLAAGAGGYWAGRHANVPPSLSRRDAFSGAGNTASAPAHAVPATAGRVVYYQDPDGRPDYSPVPRRTADGREFRTVHASEDISFEEAPADSGGAAPPDDAPKKVLYYRNPMGLPDISPVPKKDSMGMDYIPVYAGDGEDGGAVRIAPGKLQRTGVRTETVAARVISVKTRAPGTVQPDERNVSVIAVPADSFISMVENVTTGDRVRRGQPLLQLHSNDIAAAAVEVTVTPGEGTRRRLQHYGVPSEVIAEITRTRVIPSAFTWYAPRDGVVLTRNATEGMKMAAGDVLFRIADLSTVWVLADVPEYALPSVAPGQAAHIRTRSLPGRTFEGSVTLIYPQVSKETRTTKVRIVIANQDGALLPDMYADVEIETGAGKPVVAVPDSAVIDTGARRAVILARGEGRFEPREVKTGAHGGGFTEIREGIASGDQVVTAANFLIDAESNLKAALQGMTALGDTP